MFKAKPTKIAVVALIVWTVGMLGIMGWRLESGARSSSATTDEAIHILSGYLADKNGDYRLNPEHPFLGKMLAASPHLFLHTPLPDLTKFNAVANNFYYDSWSETRDTANAWLYNSGITPQDVLFPSRMVDIVALLLLGLGIAVWVAKRIGYLAAAVVVGLFTLDPTLLAHGQLANTDVWALIGWTGTILTFVDYLENPTKKQLAWVALWFGIAMNLKFSLILLVPTLLAGWVVARWRFKRPLASYGKALGVFTLGWLAVTAVTYLRSLETVAMAAAHGALSSYATFDKILPFIQWLAPAQYWKGLVMVLLGTVGGRPAYLLGHIGMGWWYYFPVAFAVKEPVILILAFVALVVIGLLRVRQWQLRGTILAIALGVYWLAAMKSQLTLGIRHLAPVLPITFVLIAAAVQAFWKTGARAARIGLGAVLVLAVGLTSLSLNRVAPYYLSYFNEFVGGPVNGQRYLADSNLDWGQALPQLADWLNSHAANERILLDYQWTGTSAPGYYGIRWEALTVDNQQSPRLIAVSRSELVSNPGYAYLRSKTPTALVGNAIAVFDQRNR